MHHSYTRRSPQRVSKTVPSEKRCCGRGCVQQYLQFQRVFDLYEHGDALSPADVETASLPQYGVAAPMLSALSALRATYGVCGVALVNRVTFMHRWLLARPSSVREARDHPLTCPCDTAIGCIMGCSPGIVRTMRQNRDRLVRGDFLSPDHLGVPVVARDLTAYEADDDDDDDDASSEGQEEEEGGSVGEEGTVGGEAGQIQLPSPASPLAPLVIPSSGGEQALVTPDSAHTHTQSVHLCCSASVLEEETESESEETTDTYSDLLPPELPHDLVPSCVSNDTLDTRQGCMLSGCETLAPITDPSTQRVVRDHPIHLTHSQSSCPIAVANPVAGTQPPASIHVDMVVPSMEGTGSALASVSQPTPSMDVDTALPQPEVIVSVPTAVTQLTTGSEVGVEAETETGSVPLAIACHMPVTGSTVISDAPSSLLAYTNEDYDSPDAARDALLCALRSHGTEKAGLPDKRAKGALNKAFIRRWFLDPSHQLRLAVTMIARILRCNTGTIRKVQAEALAAEDSGGDGVELVDGADGVRVPEQAVGAAPIDAGDAPISSLSSTPSLVSLGVYSNEDYDTDLDAHEALVGALAQHRERRAQATSTIVGGSLTRVFASRWFVDREGRPRLPTDVICKVLDCGYGDLPMGLRHIGINTLHASRSVDPPSAPPAKRRPRPRSARVVAMRRNTDNWQSAPSGLASHIAGGQCPSPRSTEEEGYRRLRRIAPGRYQFLDRVFNERGQVLCGVTTPRRASCARSVRCHLHPEAHLGGADAAGCLSQTQVYQLIQEKYGGSRVDGKLEDPASESRAAASALALRHTQDISLIGAYTNDWYPTPDDAKAELLTALHQHRVVVAGTDSPDTRVDLHHAFAKQWFATPDGGERLSVSIQCTLLNCSTATLMGVSLKQQGSRVL
ncbi:hypothetical protein KIPB_000273 [Kipferlia bialata]|uniref:Uncharacterized protein n=1 Tax=Kipferlia bialata TaxID=797122 RepID=A0A9K3CM22_9EUKA|nr:hypothetical protein KIPB_000273 [Kipferlia bialata]|eukprot:g273.t1